jgi:hypothetical protein
LLQKERKERMALMPDEDFGDFFEMQENKPRNNKNLGMTILTE